MGDDAGKNSGKLNFSAKRLTGVHGARNGNLIIFTDGSVSDLRTVTGK